MKTIFLLTVLIAQAAYGKPEGSKNECTVYPVGHNQSIGNLGYAGITVQSADGQLVATRATEGALKVSNIRTGQETVIPPHGDWINRFSFSPDSQSLVTESAGEVKIWNKKTNQQKSLGAYGYVNSLAFSPDGRFLVVAPAENTLRVVNVETGKQKVIKTSIDYTSVQYASDGKHLLAEGGFDAFDVIDPITGERNSTVPSLHGIRSASFSPDGQFILTAGIEDHDSKVIDLTTGKETVIHNDSMIITSGFSPDGQSVTIASDGAPVKVVNIKTGKQTLLRGTGTAVSSDFSSDGQSLMTLSETPNVGILKITDLKTEVVKEFPGSYRSVSYTPDRHGVFFVTQDNYSGILSTQSVCVEDQLKLESTLPACVTGANATPANGGVTDSMQTLLCAEKWSPDLAKQWDSLTPTENPLTQAHARALLLRFQKPGGFEPERHLPALLAILRSDLPKQEPELVLGVLQNILYTSNALYERLLADFPDLLKLRPAKNPKAICRTRDEDSEILASATEYLRYLRNKNGKRTKYTDWQNLLPLSSVLSKLTNAQKEEYRDDIAQRLADGAADNWQFHQVFLSKLYKFTYEATAPFFGESPRSLSDLTIQRGRDALSPLILGSSPIGGGTESSTFDYGFSAKFLPDISLEGDHTISKKVSWTQDGKAFEGDISAIILANSTSFIPSGDGPDYKSLWQDGSLNGVVITGTNLKGSSSGVLQEYLAYYQSQGFVFDEPKKEPDLKQFLKNQVTSGKMDYFVKEAHSDGDDKNLFRMDHSAMIRTGTLTRPDKTKETITLVYPDGASDKTELLPNQEFGEWVRDREKAKHGQLVYFNTSCWSHAKAVHEIEAAHSPTLLDIPSLTMMQTFSNSPGSAERLMFDAFRNGKNYEAMRAELSKNELNKTGKENVVLFPDDQGYRAHISDLLATPVDTKITITRDGTPYNIDEVQH